MMSMRRGWLACCAVLALSASPMTAVAAAAPVEQAQLQLQHGDLGSALQTLNEYLQTAPQDPDARFTRGMVLLRLDRRQEAIDTFTALTHDFPKLPEPYNNLAALYAQQGDYIKARDLLEAVLAIQPDSAAAYENLGDVYAALAGQAYTHALTLTPDSEGTRYKQSLLNQINTGRFGSYAPKPAAAAAAARP